MTARLAGRISAAVLLLGALGGVPARGQALDAAVRSFAAAWGAEDTAALQQLMAPEARLFLDGEEYMGVSPRQVAASLERLFREFRPSPPEVTRSGHVEGSPDRGFGELVWTPAAPGVAGTSRHLLFVALGRRPDGWRVTEIRILR